MNNSAPRLMTFDRLLGYASVGGHDECWEWQYHRTKHGYGRVRVGGNKGRLHRAHRLALELHSGVAIPRDRVVMHLCDNPPCINPAHLRVVTQAENVADRDSKGRNRQPRGSAAGNAKLTEEKVAVIRSRRAAGERLKVIADDFGVTEALVSQICLRRIWTHVH